MNDKPHNLIILVGMICCVCPLVASAQETPSVSQSPTSEARNQDSRETKKQKAKSASQAESDKKPNPSKNEKKQTAVATDKAKKETSSAQRKRARAKKQMNTRFVDRNGDGIHDGMEHRFRRKHQKARSSKNTDSRGRHLRQQRRRGDNASPNKGMHGGAQ